MNFLLKAGSFVGLGLTVIPAFLVLSGRLTWNTHAVLMAVGAVLWFVTAPFWMIKEDSNHGPTEG
jgi:predicted membrane channel-forming protein YqfA (hemolysin III family)